MRALSIFLLAAAIEAAQTGGFAARDAHYRLQAEDKVEVQYRYTPEYNAAVSVQPDGFVTLPSIGEVKLAGLTIAEATATIRDQASHRLNEPDVTVLLKEYVKPYFVLAGEVAKPGRVDLHGDVKLIEAIALGGGFKDSAKRTQVILLRKAGEMTDVRVVDARRLMSAAGVAEDIPIRPGDTIVVPRNFISKLEPYFRVSEPVLYTMIFRFL